MAELSYLRPASLEEALGLFRENPEAVYVAGGTDVMVRYKKGALKPRALISLGRIPGLDYVREEAGAVEIGGLASLRQLELSPLIARSFPVLHDALAGMASVQIRNVATMAGNVCNAAPSADTAPPLLALDAEVVLTGPASSHQLPLGEFFLGPGRTARRPGEILTAFVLPKPLGPAGGAYHKQTRRRAMDLPLVGVAVQVELEEDLATCRRAGIALGVAGPTPLRAGQAEAWLRGRVLDEAVLARAGALCLDECRPRDSLRCQAWYRQEMIRVQVRRMGLLALERARAAALRRVG